MKLLGFYTGNVYDESVDNGTIKECTIILNPIHDNEFGYCKKKSEELKEHHCRYCYGCEEAQSERARNGDCE